MITKQDLSMSINCSTLLPNSTMDFIDEQRNTDLLDAMADIAYEQEQAMRESSQSDWSSVDRTDGIIDIDLINQQSSQWEGVINDNQPN